MATRKKIVNALVALVGEGCVAPTAEQVAERAAVGLRTVFRHFEDMETLYREMTSELDAIVLPAVSARLHAADWRARLQQSIALRADLFERVAAYHVATQVHRHESPYLAEQLQQGEKLQRVLLAGILPKTVVQDSTRFEALLLLLSVDAWVRLRRDQALSQAAALQVMQLAADALLQGVEDTPPRGSKK